LVNMAKQNVLWNIKSNDVCIGCGVCISACPVNHLAIRFDRYGKYSIFATENCCIAGCEICVNICTFSQSAEIENECSEKVCDKKHDSITGYYNDLFLGHVCSDTMRINSSSGGLTRFLLAKLLERKLVDYVIHVVPNFAEPERLFKYSVSSQAVDVLNTSQSAYYPVEISEPLDFLRKNEGKYAIVALPCFISSLKNLQKIDGVFRNRIRFLFSLVCAQNKTKFFVDYILLMAGASKKDTISHITFRKKKPERSSLDYTFSYGTSGQDREISFLSGINKIWNCRLFTTNACNYCNDIFGIKADISLMDAWLPEYISDWKGNNIVISRNVLLSNLLQEFKELNEINLKNISLDDVLRSQEYAINKKNKLLIWKMSKPLHKYRNFSYNVPSYKKVSFFDKDFVIIAVQDILRNISIRYNFKIYPGIKFVLTISIYLIEKIDNLKINKLIYLKHKCQRLINDFQKK